MAMVPFTRLVLLVLALGSLPRSVLAGEPFVPSWIKNDPEAKTVAIEIVADWNQVERFRRGNIRTDIIDFNGYWGGNLTIMVPAAWTVQLEFINGSSSFRHSLMVTRVYAQSEMPVKLTAEDAIWGRIPTRQRALSSKSGDNSNLSRRMWGATSLPARGKRI